MQRSLLRDHAVLRQIILKKCIESVMADIAREGGCRLILFVCRIACGGSDADCRKQQQHRSEQNHPFAEQQ